MGKKSLSLQHIRFYDLFSAPGLLLLASSDMFTHPSSFPSSYTIIVHYSLCTHPYHLKKKNLTTSLIKGTLLPVSTGRSVSFFIVVYNKITFSFKNKNGLGRWLSG